MNTIDIIRLIADNREAFIAFIIALVAVVKVTAWGKAQAAALDAVVGVIEGLGAGDVKSGVSNAAVDLSAGAQDAITDSVAKADPKKSQPSLIFRVLREVFRKA
jgi:hypothetical protein